MAFCSIFGRNSPAMKKYLLIFFLLLSVSSMNAANYYWVGGSGNWSDYTNHWATSSGGSVFHIQIPSPADNVFFDSNSFPGSADIVTVDTTVIYCKNMDWTGASGNPTFQKSMSPGVYSIQIFGSLTLSNMVNWIFDGTVNFESTSAGNTITTNGATIDGGYNSLLVFNGVGGTWELTDSLTTTGIRVNAGATFITNNYGINTFAAASSFGFYNNAGTVDLGSSILNVYSFNTGKLIDADSSIINVSYNFGSQDSVLFNKVNLGCSTCYSNISSTKWCHFNSISATGNSFNFTGSANDVDLFVSSAPSVFNNGINHFTRADFMNDVTLSDTTNMDTVNFNNPGKFIKINAGKALMVASDIQILGNGGFPVTIKSGTPGAQAYIRKTSDTVCTNFIYLQDINAAGGAAFYAGANSFDLGNNTGWSFTSCIAPFSNVWPGDANYDLVANNMDILNIGLAFAETGFIRPAATITWQAEPCLDWSSQFTDGTNTKHADCDGDGTVTFSDTNAVSANYSLIHPAMIPHYTLARTATPLYIDFSSASVSSGDMVSVPVKLGTPSSPASDVYAIAFSVNYDMSLVENSSILTDYTGSWLAPSGKVHLEKNFSGIGQLDIGLSRIDHLNQSGNGTIAILNFQASALNQGNLIFSISNTMAVDKDGNEIPLVTIADTLAVLAGVESLSNSGSFSLYPNPAGNHLILNFSTEKSGNAELVISDPQGRIIKIIPENLLKQGENLIPVSVADLKAGIYILKIKTDNTESTKRFVIIR
jgi:hypothetical protein